VQNHQRDGRIIELIHDDGWVSQRKSEEGTRFEEQESQSTIPHFIYDLISVSTSHYTGTFLGRRATYSKEEDHRPNARSGTFDEGQRKR
jgi:hypothetical protein